MSEALGNLDVLALDCQAGGANPVHGDLLQLGWAMVLAPESPPRAHATSW